MNNMNTSQLLNNALHTDPKIEKSLFFQHLESSAELGSGFNKIA